LARFAGRPLRDRRHTWFAEFAYFSERRKLRSEKSASILDQISPIQTGKWRQTAIYDG
jgi:hypothetical protein